MLAVVAVTFGLFFALNIGASGAAASMGIAYGSGAIRKRLALLCCGFAVSLGAWLGGGEVVKTIGSGIVPESTYTVSVTLIIIASAAITLFLANLLGIPLSTSEVTVGSVLGAGIVYQSIYLSNLAWIMLIWLLAPVAAFFIAWLAAKGFRLKWVESRLKLTRFAPILSILIVCTGLFESFAAGMNNAANAVGPLVGAGLMSVDGGILWGGLFVALGAVFLGNRVLETNGKKITNLSIQEGCVISGTGATIVTAASLFGIPVPLTQITTSSIIAIGFAKHGSSVLRKDIVVRMLTIWAVSPIVSMVFTYALIQLIIEHQIYPVIAMAGVVISMFGMYVLMNYKNTQKKVDSNDLFTQTARRNPHTEV